MTSMLGVAGPAARSARRRWSGRRGPGFSNQDLDPVPDLAPRSRRACLRISVSWSRSTGGAAPSTPVGASGRRRKPRAAPSYYSPGRGTRLGGGDRRRHDVLVLGGGDPRQLRQRVGHRVVVALGLPLRQRLDPLALDAAPKICSYPQAGPADYPSFGGRADVICSERVFPVLTHFRHQRASQFCSDVDCDPYQD